MLNPKLLEDNQIIDQLKGMQHLENWKLLEELINRKIDHARDNLEKAQDHEAVLRLQSQIKTLRGILTFN